MNLKKDCAAFFAGSSTTFAFRNGDSAMSQPDKSDRGATISTKALLEQLNQMQEDVSDEIVEEIRRVGKHFVNADTLQSLVDSRAALRRLLCFLDVVLDKRDGRYDYPTYIALDLIPLPRSSDPRTDSVGAEHDRLFALLVADLIGFELSATGGRTAWLPHMSPNDEKIAKRCQLALKALAPCLHRQNLLPSAESGNSIAAVREVVAAVQQASSAEERKMLKQTMIPVYTIHDEHMFLRVLQSSEVAFALMTLLLSAAAAALKDGRTDQARRHLDRATSALEDAKLLFPLVATMSIEAFSNFRRFTEGASAIQSCNYKLIESLCRRPDEDRLNCAAFQSVPAVREKVLGGQLTIEEAFREARDSLPDEEREALEAAMSRFAETVRSWRETHLKLARRMLGDNKGTGGTDGIRYLESGLDIPVFSREET